MKIEDRGDDSYRMIRYTVPTSPEPMGRCHGCKEEWDRLRLVWVAGSMLGDPGRLLCPRCRGLKWPEDFMEEVRR